MESKWYRKLFFYTELKCRLGPVVFSSGPTNIWKVRRRWTVHRGKRRHKTNGGGSTNTTVY